MTIKQKADRAFSALHQAEYAKGNDIEGAVCDLLADLIHLSKDYSFTVAEVLERAQVHATTEAEDAILETVPAEKRFHIIHTSNGGPVLVSFDCEDDRAEWCEKQDDTFETFVAVDGLIDNVLTPIIGEQNA